MKKIAIMLALMLCIAGNIYAITPTELVGKWKSNTTKTEATPDMPMAMETTDEIIVMNDMTVKYTSSCAMFLSIDTGVYVDLYLKGKLSGTVKIEGDKIIITPDPESIKIEFSEDDVRVRGINDPEMVASAQKAMYQQFQPMTTQIAEGMKTDVIFENVIISNKGKTLTCTSDGDEMTFKKK